MYTTKMRYMKGSYITMKAKSKILILSDGQNWIVDRIADEMIKRMPFEFTKEYYTKISTDDLIKKSQEHDLTHYMNWDFSYHLGSENKLKNVLMSVRSHRYPDYVEGLQNTFNIHVVNKDLLEKFPKATYIPDAVFDHIYPARNFTVGMAFQAYSSAYKGFELVKEACDRLGVDLRIATRLNPTEMMSFYKSVDLMVVASVNEGFNTIAMECLMANIPVITTNVGVVKDIDCNKIERDVDSIVKGILKYYTYPLVKEFRYENICNQFTKLYGRLL